MNIFAGILGVVSIIALVVLIEIYYGGDKDLQETCGGEQLRGCESIG